MNTFELDLNYNNEQSEVLAKPRPAVTDVYQQAITYGKKKGLSEKQIFEVFSQATGGECDKAYNDALVASRNAYSLTMAVDKVEAEAQKTASKARKDCLEKIAKKDKRGQFWNNLLSGITTTAQAVSDYGATSSGQNIGEAQQQQFAPPPPADTDVRILGMKPLVFTLVALGVVVAGGIGIAMLGKKAGKK